jgi:lysophospholipase L1-like esterase
MGARKKLGMGLLVAAGVLVGVELLLALLAAMAGVELRVSPLPQPADHSVLCESTAPGRVRLCPDRGAEWDRVRDLSFDLAPRGQRVVFIGESFVYGLGLDVGDAPPARLQSALGGAVEVLNLGRCGTYASRLLPHVQAAVTLDADVVVLAIGNNEHTMTSFYTGAPGRHPLLTFRVLSVFSRSRLFGMLSRALGTDDAMRVAESVDQQGRTFDDPVDAAVYAARRRPPDLTRFPDGVARREVTEVLEAEQRLKEEVFEGHLRKLVRVAASGGADVVLVTLPWSLRTAPSLSGTTRITREEAAALIEQSLHPGRGGPMTWARAGIAADPHVAQFHHVEGRELHKAGDLAGAAASWRRVADLDLIPDATPSINDIIRRVAAEEGAALADVDRATEAAFVAEPDRFFLDKVHVSADGADEVARVVGPTVQAALDAR